MQASTPFIFVVIDGNRLPISEHLIAQGTRGGHITAMMIRATVEDNLRQRGLDTHRFATTRIVLFADLGKLAKSYRQIDLPVEDFFKGLDDDQYETVFQEVDRTFVSRKSLEGELPACRTFWRCAS